MKNRIREIDVEMNKLSAEKEMLENSMKAEQAKALIAMLPKCEFWVSDYFTVEVFAKDKKFEKELDVLVHKFSGGWNHFEVPIHAQIVLRGDDGTYAIQFNPSNSSEETMNKEYDKKYQFEKIVEFLKENGVNAAQFYIDRIKNNLDLAKKNLVEAQDDLKYVTTTINKTEVAS